MHQAASLAAFTNNIETQNKFSFSYTLSIIKVIVMEDHNLELGNRKPTKNTAKHLHLNYRALPQPNKTR